MAANNPLGERDESSVDWACIMGRIPPHEQELIGAIVQRAVDIVKAYGLKYDADYLGTAQAENAAKLCHLHATCCPLKLMEFLMADIAPFAHDFGGIMAYFNVKTGRIDGDWWPVHAQKPRDGAGFIILPGDARFN